MYTPHPLSENFPPPWNRILPHAANLFAWGVLIGLIYLLRSFFLLIFLVGNFGLNASEERGSGEVQFRKGFGVADRVVHATQLALPRVLRVPWRMKNLPACSNPKMEKS